MEKGSKLKTYGLWVLSGLLTAAFLMAGGSKVTGAEMIVQNFEKWGYPTFFLYVVGLTEIICAIGLWIPRFRGLAALGLVGLMVGAVRTHLLYAEFNQLGPAVVLGILALILFRLRYSEVRTNFFPQHTIAEEKA